jgi:hypothetical protein
VAVCKHHYVFHHEDMALQVGTAFPLTDVPAVTSKHDFDFLAGSWNIRNRFLNGRLCGSNDWIEFDARFEFQLLLDGLGNLDRYSAARDGKSIEGITLRLFNPATGQWSIHWADNVRPGSLLPPMVGTFNGALGEFFGEEYLADRKVLCRFHWYRSGPDSPRWEQAFSDDGGKTWETNWIMYFAREEQK